MHKCNNNTTANINSTNIKNIAQVANQRASVNEQTESLNYATAVSLSTSATSKLIK